MEANINIYQQHLNAGWKNYLEVFIDNLVVQKIPLQQQRIINECFEDIASNNINSVSFELIIHQLVIDLNEHMIVWRMIKNLRVNQLFVRGPLYIYLISLPDIKSCLTEITRLIGFFLDASYSLHCYQSDQSIIIEPQELVDEYLASFLKADTSLCLTLYILKELVGPIFDYETIYIPNNRTGFDANVTLLFTKAKIIFHDGPMMASFHVKQVNIKNKSFDREYNQQLSYQVSELLSTFHLKLSLTEKVQKYILSVEKPARQTREMAADHFKMSKSTFSRKLKEEKQSFKEIQNEIIWELAIKALTTTTITIQNFALYMGYAERSSFERFFRKKFTLSPAKYRKKHMIRKVK